MIVRSVPEKTQFIALLVAWMGLVSCSTEVVTSSPDGDLSVVFLIDNGTPSYLVRVHGKTVLDTSRLGVTLDDRDLSTGLKLQSASGSKGIHEAFTMLQGKRLDCTYDANRREFHLQKEDGGKLDIIFQVSNDGMALQYVIPGQSDSPVTLTSEQTSFHFAAGTTAFLQPMSEAKSGWSRVNPCYEEYYQMEIPAGTPAPSPAGWVYPALFHHGETWVLVTESGLGRDYCGTHLRQNSPGGVYRLGFPEEAEALPGGGVNPTGVLPLRSPWRVLAIGSLRTIVESTLGEALAPPPSAAETDYIKPGYASWSWPLLKDDSIVYRVQKRFVDYSADMHWAYCLVDVNWDTKIGYDRIAELASYAATMNVGLILWYNSSGDWNDTRYTPKSRLLTHEDRIAEFVRLEKMGIKGVKIDFFGGDGQSMIGYYLDILADAARYHLLVNFHGATIPRGWQRTYPNLMSMEAVKGFEYVTFEQANADQEPSHCCVLPFARNAFDPMDFTPLSLDSVPGINRRTTPGFELALSVLFLSGIQHYAETPSGMNKQPSVVKEFLRDLPTQWEEVRSLGGYPGKDIVVARRYHDRWYVAGINGEDSTKSFKLDLSFLKDRKGTIITDATGSNGRTLAATSFTSFSTSTQVPVTSYGGFVIIVE